MLQAAAFQDSNVIYVLDMGEPVKIIDLARQMIEFIAPEEPVEIIFTGLRPGEKLHEHLFEVSETPAVSSHQKIMRLNPFNTDETVILEKLPMLFEKARSDDFQAIYELLEKWIPSYKPFNMEQIGMVVQDADNYSVNANEPLVADRTTNTGSLKYQ